MAYYPKRNRAIEYIILANALVFFITIASPGLTESLLALQPATVFQQPWTIVTSMFMHAGLDHILFNMIALFFFGTYLERITSEKDFIKVYFIGGIFASLFYTFISLAFSFPDPRTIAVGASGAIAAVIGALIVLRPNLTVYLYFFLPLPLWVFGIVFILWSTSAGIAFTAHLGGLMAGLAFGYLLKKKEVASQYSATYGYRYGY